MNIETWLPVVGYEGYYEISDFGNARSVDREIRNGISSRLRKGRVLKFGWQNSGYLIAPLWKDNKGSSPLVHRLVAMAFLPNVEKKEFVNHIDGVKHNNLLSNLEWCTRLENHQHAARIGLMRRGDSHYATKLSFTDVLKVREMAAAGIRNVDIARHYNVSATLTCGIVKGRYRRNY